ncbi:transglutaminase-like domain-containing protein [Candidatus Micrarchaeota archaeon]|nr:transglutaminase-like domain-containing protein [Candidatus Micrarchaeota archaeon]
MRQVTRQLDKRPVIITKDKCPLTDTLWFPIKPEDAREMHLLDLSGALKLWHPGIDSRIFLLCRNGQQMERSLSSKKILSFADISDAAKQGCEGIVIPTTAIDIRWVTRADMIDRNIMELSVRLALLITYTNEIPAVLDLHDADKALGSLSLQFGNCYHMSTLLTAILRKNGVPARLVGYEDESDASPKNHWWVQAYVDSEWRDYDACFVPALLQHAVAQATSSIRKDKTLRKALVSAVIDTLEESRIKQPVTFVEDKKYRYGIEGFVPAEFEL